MAKPIIEFTDEAQAYECLKEWQTRLFLNDWIIKLILIEPHEFAEEKRIGECEACYTNNCAVIRILKLEHYPSDAIEKYCAEQILVHELLHCLIIGYEKKNPTIEECFFDIKNHLMVDQMAKSLIMAKYAISLDWFKNF